MTESPVPATASEQHSREQLTTGNGAVWAAAAAAVLRRSGRLADTAPDSDVWRILEHRGVDGVTTPPLGLITDVAALPTAAFLAADPGRAPFLRGSRETAGWDVRARVAGSDPAEVHRIAQEEIAGGVTSLWLTVGDGALHPKDVAAALNGLDLSLIPIVVQPVHTTVDPSLAAGRALATLAGDRGRPLHPACSLGADPIGESTRIVLQTGRPATHAAAPWTPDMPQLAAELGVGAIVVDGTVVHQAGASDAQEIGYTLATGATYLRVLTEGGLDVDAACRLISFRYAVTDQQFTQIAKLRAARLAWARLCELSGAAPEARAQRQHGVTSAAMFTRYDRHTNMLRGTVATFAAAIGGADAVTTLPFDSALKEPDSFSRRMARNVSALLTGESGLDQVADPAGGAGAIEVLTERIASAGWSAFRAFEKVGGIEAALVDGSLLALVADTRAERERHIATRQVPITGISEYPNSAETAAELPQRSSSHSIAALPSWAEPFETMRDNPPPQSMLLVRVGTEAAASPRVTFTRNLLAAGGVSVIERSFDALGDIGDEIDAPAAILAGADRDYAQYAAAAVAALRVAGVQELFLAGRPRDLDQGLRTIATGDDVLAFLSTVRTALGGDQ